MGHSSASSRPLGPGTDVGNLENLDRQRIVLPAAKEDAQTACCPVHVAWMQPAMVAFGLNPQRKHLTHERATHNQTVQIASTGIIFLGYQ